MIHILASSNVIPGKMAEYIANGAARFPEQKKVGMKLLGQWRAYSGNTNRLYGLFAYNDLTEFQHMYDARAKNDEYQKGSAKTQALLSEQSWVFISPYDWWPVKSPVKPSIYLLSVNDVIPGKMAEYEAIRKELSLIMQKVGMNQVGMWRGYSGNPNRVYNLFSYNDVTEYNKVRSGRANDSVFVNGTNKMVSLFSAQSTTFLEPFAWSPMK